VCVLLMCCAVVLCGMGCILAVHAAPSHKLSQPCAHPLVWVCLVWNGREGGLGLCALCWCCGVLVGAMR
jgi:hypothetical protein